MLLYHCLVLLHFEAQVHGTAHLSFIKNKHVINVYITHMHTLSNSFCTLSDILDIPMRISAFVILVSDSNKLIPGSRAAGTVRFTAYNIYI